MVVTDSSSGKKDIINAHQAVNDMSKQFSIPATLSDFLGERLVLVVSLRERKYTFKEIGSAIGCSAGRVQQMLEEARKKREYFESPDVYFGLTIRAKNCLINYGIKEKSQVKHLVDTGLIARIRNCGTKTQAEICQWAGIYENPMPIKIHVGGSVVCGDLYNGIEWLACWLLDNVEGEMITEEQLRPWAAKAWEAHLKKKSIG